MAPRATSLGSKPSLFYFLFVFLCFSFLSLLLIDKNLFFPLQKGIFGLFLSVSLSFSVAFFGLPLFEFLFLCLSFSLSLSISISRSFLSFFLLVFLFCFLSAPWFSLFLSFSSLLLFHARSSIKTLNCNCFSSIFSFFGFLSCFFFPIPFSYLCMFLILSYVFCSTSMFLVENIKVEKHQFLVKRGVATKRYFYEPVFWKMWKVIVFFCPFFGPILVDVQKHYENRYFSTFLKQKKQKYHFEVLLSGPSRCYYLGQVDCNLKMANLAQIITPQVCARNFFQNKKCWTPPPPPQFYSAFWQTVFVKSKLGPDDNTSKGQTWHR